MKTTNTKTFPATLAAYIIMAAWLTTILTLIAILTKWDIRMENITDNNMKTNIYLYSLIINGMFVLGTLTSTLIGIALIYRTNSLRNPINTNEKIKALTGQAFFALMALVPIWFNANIQPITLITEGKFNLCSHQDLYNINHWIKPIISLIVFLFAYVCYKKYGKNPPNVATATPNKSDVKYS
jgi:hypothetical protein